VIFPRTLYKKDGPKVAYVKKNKVEYSETYVKNKDEYSAALKEGYIDDFNTVVSGEVKKTVVEVDDF
jgi:hypothetical protein